MRNLEQIRANNALGVKIERDEKDSKSIAKKVPAMIMNNGLIGAAAFAQESNVEGYQCVFENGIIKHLRDKDIQLIQCKSCDIGEFIAELTKVSSTKLRVITAEVMAYLNYLRRFAK